MLSMLLLLLVLVAGMESPAQRPASPPDGFFTSTLPPSELSNRQAVIETTHGTIVMDLLADAAPNHVAHFITEARQGAYDGTTFHRVIAMAIVQGGDPVSTDPSRTAEYGTGGLKQLRFEPNDEMHTRGAVSAVLVPGDRDSAGSQFFICVTDQPALDGQYTVFARVVEGILVAQAISLAAAKDGIPAERIEIRSVTIRERPAPEPEPFSTDTVDDLSAIRAVLDTTLGSVTVEFLPNKAPNHVRHFLRLAAAGVYDGTAFHRVVPGFVLQGGHVPTRREPLDERQEAFVRPLQAEFNDTVHELGTLSMARDDDPASALTSFFIVLDRSPALDGQYTAFARVAAGLDVVQRLAGVPLEGEEPVERIEVRRVTIERR
jgi:peptidyl-prolyl cis-trans isomerase B (cyclophilin B)